MRGWYPAACSLLLLATVGSSSASAGSLSPPEPDLGAAAEWSRFQAPALGIAVDYPANVFSVRDGPPEQGEGERFRTSDGRARLSLYALENEDHDTPATYLKKYLRVQRGALAYRRVSHRFFAISGVHEGRIYYSRCNFSSDPEARMHCIYIVYPQREARSWDHIVTRISRSLRARAAGG